MALEGVRGETRYSLSRNVRLPSPPEWDFQSPGCGSFGACGEVKARGKEADK